MTSHRKGGIMDESKPPENFEVTDNTSTPFAFQITTSLSSQKSITLLD